MNRLSPSLQDLLGYQGSGEAVREKGRTRFYRFTQQSFAMLSQSLNIYTSLASYKYTELSKNLAQMSVGSKARAAPAAMQDGR